MGTSVAGKLTAGQKRMQAGRDEEMRGAGGAPTKTLFENPATTTRWLTTTRNEI